MRQPPASRPVGYQRWNHLLFLHWQVEACEIQATLPSGLTVDLHEGAAYLGIVPFFMQRIRPAFLPPVPWLSWFLELNVRTYVHDAADRPGVWFYSLDCNQALAVTLARQFFHLPYFRSRMSACRAGDTVDYRSQRREEPGPPARYLWTPHGAAKEAEPGSLEFFLAERYALFCAAPSGQLYEGRVHHAPYRLRETQVQEWSLQPASMAGFQLSYPPCSALAADYVDVAIHSLVPIASAGDTPT